MCPEVSVHTEVFCTYEQVLEDKHGGGQTGCGWHLIRFMNC